MYGSEPSRFNSPREASNEPPTILSSLRFQNFKRLPIPDSRDTAIGHSLGQCDAALIGNVTKTATDHRVAKTKHQGPTIIVDAVTERVFDILRRNAPAVESQDCLEAPRFQTCGRSSRCICPIGPQSGIAPYRQCAID